MTEPIEVDASGDAVTIRLELMALNTAYPISFLGAKFIYVRTGPTTIEVYQDTSEEER